MQQTVQPKTSCLHFRLLTSSEWWVGISVEFQQLFLPFAVCLYCVCIKTTQHYSLFVFSERRLKSQCSAEDRYAPLVNSRTLTKWGGEGISSDAPHAGQMEKLSSLSGPILAVSLFTHTTPSHNSNPGRNVCSHSDVWEDRRWWEKKKPQKPLWTTEACVKFCLKPPSAVYFRAVNRIYPHAARALLRPVPHWRSQQHIQSLRV